MKNNQLKRTQLFTRTLQVIIHSILHTGVEEPMTTHKDSGSPQTPPVHKITISELGSSVNELMEWLITTESQFRP